MTPLKIKILLLKKQKNITGMARAYALRKGIDLNSDSPNKLDSLRKQFSMCVNGDREYPDLQEFIAEELETPVEQLFPQRRRKAA
jgi:hypothetical protein